MKRDMDLIRKILFNVEEKETPSGWIKITTAEHSDEEVAYHIMILDQAGYIDAIDLTSDNGFDWQARNLTWRGHEFLDACRENGIWEKFKNFIGKNIKSVPFDIAKEILISLVKEQLKLK